MDDIDTRQFEGMGGFEDEVKPMEEIDPEGKSPEELGREERERFMS